MKNVFALSYKSFRSLKRLAKFAALFCAFFASAAFCATAFCETYYWAGGGANNNWKTKENWRTGSEAGPVATAYPTTGDIAYIAGTYTVTINDDITVDELRIQRKTPNLTSDWTTKFTGNKSLTFGSMEFDRASGTDGVIGTLEIGCPMECSGNIITHSGTTLSVKSGKTLQTNELTHIASNSEPKSLITVEGTLKANNAISLKDSGRAGCNSLQVLSSGEVQAASLIWDTGVYSNKEYPAIDNAGTIILSGNLITLSGNGEAKGEILNSGTIQSTGGTMAFAAETTNSGTLQTNAGEITFSDKVTGDSGTIETTTGNITTSADTASNLGTVQTNGGSLTNSGAGAVTVTEFKMGADTSVTNSTGGAVTIDKLTGNSAATLTGGANAITVSSYANTPTIKAAAGSVVLGEGTIGELSVDTSVTATVSGALTVSGTTTNDGTILTGANDITFAGAVTSGADAKITTTTGGITVSAAADSSLGIVTSSGGPLTNSGSGATTVADFVTNADTAITNSAGGSLVLSKLSGDKTATLKSVTADDGIKVDAYDATTKIAVAESSKNILLASGTLDAITINGSAKATVSGNITTTNGITNSGTLATSATLAIGGGVTNSGTIDVGANDITFNGAIIGEDGTIETSGGNITTSAATESALGTVQTTSGVLINSGEGAVTVAEFSAGAATSIKNTAAGSITLENIASSSTTTLSGDIKVTAYADGLPIIVDAATGTSANNTQLGAGKPDTLTVAAGAKATIFGDIETSGNISNAGTLTASANLTFASNFTNTGTFSTSDGVTMKATGASVTLSGAGSSTISKFVYAPTTAAGSILTIESANSFKDFSCEAGGATLTIKAAQGVSGTLTLRGASESSPLAITGTVDGAFNISSNQSSGRYLKVDRDLVSIGGKFFKATDSVYNTSDEDKKYGVHQNWVLMNSAMKFIWTGATSSEWEKTSNWKCNLIPGKHHGTGDASDNVDTQGVDVIIPDAPSGGRFPVAAAGYTLGNLTVGGSSHLAELTISAQGTSTEEANHIKLSGDFKNYGRIIYTNTGRITKQNATPYAFTNDDENQGTVEFTVPPETATGVDLASVSYWNLEITGSGTYTASAGLTVKNALIVSGELAASAGNVNFNASAGATATTVKTARFNTSGRISFGNDADDSFEVTAGALELPATSDTLGDLTLAGKIKASGGISLPKNATLTSTKALLAANTTFESPTTLSGDITLSGAFTVTNADAATLNTSAGVLTLENASLENTGAVADGKIKFTGTSDQTFSPNESSTYDSVAIDKTSDGSVTVNKALSTKELAIKQAAGKSAAFGEKAAVAQSFDDDGNAGDITFDKGCAFTPTTLFKTTGAVTLNGSTSPTAPCAFTGGVTHTAGQTILRGALNTTDADISLGATTLASDTTINAGSGAVTIQGALETLNGTQALASAGSGSVTFGGRVGETAQPASIAVAGPAAINAAVNVANTITIDGATNVNAPSITSGGLQHYKGDLTFATSAPGCALTGTVQADGNISNTGILDASAAKITMTGAAPSFTGNATAANTKVKDFIYAPADTTGAGLTVANNNTFTIFSCATGNAKITLNGANTFGTFTASGANSSVTLNGANTFTALSMTSGGGTLTVNAAQTVTTLTLKGTDAATANLLNVTGTNAGSLNISSTQSSGQYISVEREKVSIGGGNYYYNAIDSTYKSAPEYGEHQHWILMNSAMVFEWTGAATSGGNPDSAWSNPDNWNYHIVPGLESATAGVSTKGYSVIIPNAPTGNPSNFPNAAADYSVKDLKIGQSSPSSANLTLSAAGNVDVDAGETLVNYGSIFYSSSGRLTKGGTFYNDTANGGTVDFTGDVDSADLASVQYYNLIVSGDGAFSSAADKTLTVLNDMTYSGGGTLATNGAVTVTRDLLHTGSGNLTANGSFTVGNDLTKSGSGALTTNVALTVTNALTVSAGSASFNASSGDTETKAGSANFTPAVSGGLSLSLGNTAGDKFTLTGSGSALVLPAALGGLDLAGTISAGTGAGIMLGHDATLKANTTFASDTTLNAAVTLSGSHLVTTNAELTTSPTNTLTLNDANLTNAAAVNSGDITFTESSQKEQTFTPCSSNYNKVIVNKASGGSLKVAAAMDAADFTIAKNGTLEASGAVTIQNLSINQNASADFAALVKVTNSYADGTTAGAMSFNAGCDFTPTTLFNTTGAVTLNGSTSPTAPCAFTGGVTHTAGQTILRGALNTTDKPIVLGATTLASDTTINAGSGTAAFGAIDCSAGESFPFVSNGSGLLTFGGRVGETAQPASIAVAGPAAINAAVNVADTITIDGATNVNAPSITSGGLQHYKGDLSFGSNCEVTGTTQVAANVATSAAVTATFIDNLWLYSSAPAALGGNGGIIDAKQNIYFVGESKNAAVKSSVQAKNILLLHGNLSLEANAALTSNLDMIWLGKDYSIDDTKETSASQVAGLFAYNHGSRKKAASYTDPFPSACPDTTPVSQSWSASVSAASGATVAAGQNFYANGLSILGSGSWSLNIPDNDLQTASFAELYNSKISNCSANHSVAAAENNTVTSCSNIQTKRPLIKEAYTVYDDAIYISFKDSDGNNVAIENSCNEISAAVSSILHSEGAYEGTFVDSDCKTSTDGKGDLTAFYIKAKESDKWKTDANGTTKGAEESSNRSGAVACKTIPYLNIPKALAALYESLRDSSKNRITHYYNQSPDTSAQFREQGKTFTAVEDKCAPVLIKVLTGQEMHEPPASQADYDAHNFVEFVYSEPVSISGGSTSVLDSDTNIQAANDLGATTNNSSGITFAGLATCSAGKINADLKSGSGSPHALYRKFPRAAGVAAQNNDARVRISIAGYVDGTITAPGGSFKNWTGYISLAETPQGTIDRIANDFIKDKSPAQNSLTIVSTDNHVLPQLQVTVENAATTLYGSWDVTPPSLAPVRINGTNIWEKPATDASQEYEIVGASYATGTLSAIEVHWFDNEPTYTENRQWFSRVGWADASSPTEYSYVSSFAADVRGGSRSDNPESNATKGGIRYCSIYDANNSFTYAIDGTSTYYNFSQKIRGGAESSLFTYAGDAVGATVHTTGAEDGLYCKLMLDQTGYTLQTTFLMTFDSTTCHITDLAGNRIQCGKIRIKSIDRTPPAFTMSAVPLGTKQMMIIFSKALNTNSLILYNSPTDHVTVPALEYIPKSLELTSASGTGIQIDQNVPASCLFKTKNATGLVVTLNQNAVLNDITKGVFVTAKSRGYNYDPLSGITAPMTYIQDAIGNYVVGDSQHAFSDFAVNAVQPQYAYDNSLTDSGTPTGYGLYQDGSWAVRDWNAEQANYGTLSAAKEILMQTSLYDGTDDKSGGLDPNGQLASGTLSAFFDAYPDLGSVSSKINENTGLSLRIWHPNYTDDVFTSLALVNNKYQFSVDGTANDSGVVFDIAKSLSTDNWKSGDQVSFLFKMGNYTVDHFANGINYPLYAARLKDPNDIASLDLWSFKIKTTNLQRGGVSILNNVIDLNNGEHTVIQVDMKESGNLNVMVMTLDGNIVTYLRHGQTDAGTHYYNWNGTNNGGSKVARGLYFVRVIGPGIDETRKVMCVK